MSDETRDNLVPFPAGGTPDKAGATPAGRMMAMVRELLAEGEHLQWIAWAANLLPELEKVVDLDAGANPALESLRDRVARWERLVATPYAALTEDEKNADREWADKVMERIQPVVIGMAARERELLEGFKALIDDNKRLLTVAEHHELGHAGTCSWRPQQPGVTT